MKSNTYARLLIGQRKYRDEARLRDIDWSLLMLMYLIIAVGIVSLYSASQHEDEPYYVRQLIWVTIGSAGVFMTLYARILDYKRLLHLSPIIYALTLGVLAYVLFFGRTIAGTQAWIIFGGGFLRVQPSEFAKLALILFLAHFLAERHDKIRRPIYYILTWIIAGIPSMLILMQPDLGTAVALPAVTFVMLYLAGARLKHLAYTVIMGILGSGLAWSFLETYQRNRFLYFFNPASDPHGDRGVIWQSIQSKLAIGGGMIFGRGFLKGLQSRLDFLPEQQTDFIFSVFAEEWGFAGVLVLLTLYTALLLKAAEKALQIEDTAGSLLIGGLMSLLAFHIVVNLAVAMSMLPVTGIPLPFMSYGGSFMVSMMLAVALMANAGKQSKMF